MYLEKLKCSILLKHVYAFLTKDYSQLPGLTGSAAT